MGLIPERLVVQFCGELLGHEAEFHERAHVILQQAVIDLIDVGKIVDRFSVGIFIVQTDFVVEDGMKPNVCETRWPLPPAASLDDSCRAKTRLHGPSRTFAPSSEETVARAPED